MGNVASLELCRELYELSGWDETLHHYFTNTGDWDNAYLSRAEAYTNPKLENGKSCPAYDSGYLLRKLPVFVAEAGLFILPMADGSWGVQYGYPKPKRISKKELLFYADTPEDALCKLSIELWKQGELK